MTLAIERSGSPLALDESLELRIGQDVVVTQSLYERRGVTGGVEWTNPSRTSILLLAALRPSPTLKTRQLHKPTTLIVIMNRLISYQHMMFRLFLTVHVAACLKGSAAILSRQYSQQVANTNHLALL